MTDKEMMQALLAGKRLLRRGHELGTISLRLDERGLLIDDHGNESETDEFFGQGRRVEARRVP